MNDSEIDDVVENYEHSYKGSPISQLLNDSELDDVVEKLSSGPGYVVLSSVFSQWDAENAYNIILEEMNSNQNDVNTSYSDIRQNHYPGILYGLLSQGDIFQKFAANTIILQISNRILGEKSRLSSLSSNTVYKGMKGQNPHTDYPYHPHLWPQGEGKNFATPHLMSLTFITALTDLTPENGSTALVPGSQRNPEFPDDVDEFEKNPIQISAKRGDLVIIAGSIQHCSMPNKTEIPRCAILQQMVSLFVNPFEDFRDFENVVPKDDKVWKKLLAMDHPLPKNQFNKNTRFQF